MDLIHDARQPLLPWPGKMVRCPKCNGTGEVARTLQHTAGANHSVIGGKRVTCSACGGKKRVKAPRTPGSLLL